MQQTSDVFRQIIKLLEENKVEYDLIVHQPVYTSQDAARIRDTNIHQGAKAIIFTADQKPILIVVPGDYRIDTKKFKKEYQIRDLQMMKPEEIKELTGLEIGAIPPFGNVMGLPMYVDQELLKNDWISFNAGAHTQSVKMKARDFIHLAKPHATGNFNVPDSPTA